MAIVAAHDKPTDKAKIDFNRERMRLSVNGVMSVGKWQRTSGSKLNDIIHVGVDGAGLVATCGFRCPCGYHRIVVATAAIVSF